VASIVDRQSVLVDLTVEELVGLVLVAQRGLKPTPKSSAEYAIGIVLIPQLHRAAASENGRDRGNFGPNSGNGVDVSPSTVGIDLGEQFVKGIAIGLGHTADIASQSTKVAALLTSAITPNVTPLAIQLPAAIAPHIAALSAATANVAAVTPATTTPAMAPIHNTYNIRPDDIPTAQQIAIINRKQAMDVGLSIRSR